MTQSERSELRQRADYTHKHNLKTGRHGWLRLTPAYSVKVVEELIEQFDHPMRIYDPFCGTATTALSAAYHGHEGVTTEINPFLVWLGNAKTAQYSKTSITGAKTSAAAALAFMHDGKIEPFPAPLIHNIERWWTSSALLFLQRLRAAIDHVTKSGSPERTLLLVSFCRSLIALSNAAFNHQSMSFKDSQRSLFESDAEMERIFESDVSFVLGGASDNPTGSATVLLGDSRRPAAILNGKFDRVITSPPYANRMSYIRELRPYMYWLGFLVNGRDAGELDWSTIGGTWGVATSRLLSWEKEKAGFNDAGLQAALDQIAHQDNKNGALLANYIAKYFEDMWEHFRNLTPVLAEGAELHYIVGNSTFYQVLLPVEQIYAAMLESLGFQDIECRAIRKRNSKKELVEFDVVATWRGGPKPKRGAKT